MRCHCFSYQLLPKRAEPGQSLALGKRPKQQPSKKKKNEKKRVLLGEKRAAPSRKSWGEGGMGWVEGRGEMR